MGTDLTLFFAMDMTEIEYNYNGGASRDFFSYGTIYTEPGGLGLYGSSHANHCLEVLTTSTNTADIDYSITMPASGSNFLVNEDQEVISETWTVVRDDDFGTSSNGSQDPAFSMFEWNRN